jgi:RNA polymerase sigma-70 factor (ECF subfamily)
VTAYIEAIEHADVDGVVAILTEDAAWSMPPLPSWYQGLDEIIAFLTRSPFTLRWRHLPTRVNGQLAVGCYIWDAERGDFEAGVIDVLTLRGDRIAEVTASSAASASHASACPSGCPPDAPGRAAGLRYRVARAHRDLERQLHQAAHAPAGAVAGRAQA